MQGCHNPAIAAMVFTVSKNEQQGSIYKKRKEGELIGLHNEKERAMLSLFRENIRFKLKT